MNFDFKLLLIWLIIITGLIPLIDYLFFAKKRKALAAAEPTNKLAVKPKIVEYAGSLFLPILLTIFVIYIYIY